MAGLVQIEDEVVVNICTDKTEGEVSVYFDLPAQLPKQPAKQIYYFTIRRKRTSTGNAQNSQIPRGYALWRRMEMPEGFRKKYTPYISQEYKRRRDGVWFYNNGVLPAL